MGTKHIVPRAEGEGGIGTATLGWGELFITNTTADSPTQGGKLTLTSNDGAAMQDGSRLGVIEFKGAESSSTLTIGARIEAICDAAWTATENGTSLKFFTTDADASESLVLTLDSNKLATFTGSVAISADVSAVNATLTGYLRGPASFVIDPATHGNDTGTVVIAGNLQVDGTTTTVNSTVVTIDDPIFSLGGDTAPGSDDDKDRGIEFRYYSGSAKIGFFGYDDSASAFTFIADATNSSEVFSGSAGNVIFGNITGTLQTAAQANVTSLGTLTGLTINGDLTLTGASYNVVWDKSDNALEFSDDSILRIGDGSDLDIFHSSNVNFLKTQTNSVLKFVSASDADILKLTPNGAVDLYFNNNLVLTTTNSGIKIPDSGNIGCVSDTDLLTLASASLTVAGNVKVGSSSTVTPATQADDIVIDKGASESGITLVSTAAASLRFGDAASASVGYIEYNHSSNAFIFGTNGGTRLTIASGGGAAFSGNIEIPNDGTIGSEGTADGIKINSSGKIGINSSSTSLVYPLEVHGGNGDAIIFKDTTNSVTTWLGAFGGAAVAGALTSGDDFALYAGNAEKVRILSNGSLGVGTTSPQSKIHSDVSIASGNFLTSADVYALEVSNSNTTAGNAVGINFGHGGYNFTNFIASVRTGTGANPTGDLVFGGRPSDGATFVERLRISSAGEMIYNSGGFIDFDGQSLQLNTQRNPNTGVFNNTSRSNAAIGLSGADGGSEIIFKTAAANNTTATTRFTIKSDGNVEIANGSLQIANAGDGINFSATSDASGSSSEVLDDYEEGSWTPTLSTTGGSVGTASSAGQYTKIGRQVIVHFQFTLSSSSGGSGSLLITNLPFTVAANSGAVTGSGRILDLGQSIAVGHYTSTNQISIFKYNGNYAGTDFFTTGFVTYYVA